MNSSINQFYAATCEDPRFISKVFTTGFSLPGSGTLRASLNCVLRSFKSKTKSSSKILKPNTLIEKSVVSLRFLIVGTFTIIQSVLSWVVKENFNSSKLSSGCSNFILSNLTSAPTKSDRV